jgi:hypothetical protein
MKDLCEKQDATTMLAMDTQLPIPTSSNDSSARQAWQEKLNTTLAHLPLAQRQAATVTLIKLMKVRAARQRVASMVRAAREE